MIEKRVLGEAKHDEREKLQSWFKTMWYGRSSTMVIVHLKRKQWVRLSARTSTIWLDFARDIHVHWRMLDMQQFLRRRECATSIWRQLNVLICQTSFGRKSNCLRTTNKLLSSSMNILNSGPSSSDISANKDSQSSIRWSLGRGSLRLVGCTPRKKWSLSTRNMRRERKIENQELWLLPN